MQMVSGVVWRVLAAGAVSLAAFGQTAPRIAPIPKDPIEMVTGQVKPVDTPSRRAAALQLLEGVRAGYGLRSSGQGYDLKVSFRVNSGGVTEYDGAWKMHEMFDPQQGLRWTAKTANYSIVRISVNGMLYGDDPGSYVPLRLQEARAALFDPLPSTESLTRASMRKSSATLNGARLTCLLISAPGKVSDPAAGRRWDETEECIDPQTGMLRTHSQVPGRYYSYDYSNALKFAGHLLPRKVTVTEGGKTITEISVDSLTELPSTDASLFVPTEEMKAKGRAVAMTGAQKIARFVGRTPFPPGSTIHAVCVFGVVTPAGQLEEAHSLQPADPNSGAALEDAKKIDFSRATPLGVHPQQHFVFVIEKFLDAPSVH